jgi:hypothetical protein
MKLICDWAMPWHGPTVVLNYNVGSRHGVTDNYKKQNRDKYSSRFHHKLKTKSCYSYSFKMFLTSSGATLP